MSGGANGLRERKVTSPTDLGLRRVTCTENALGSVPAFSPSTSAPLRALEISIEAHRGKAQDQDLLGVYRRYGLPPGFKIKLESGYTLSLNNISNLELSITYNETDSFIDESTDSTYSFVN